jgi:hypothetical protein
MDFVLQDWFSRVQRLYVYASAREWEHIYYGIPLMQHIIYDWPYFRFIVEGKGDSGIKGSPLSHPKTTTSQEHYRGSSYHLWLSELLRAIPKL